MQIWNFPGVVKFESFFRLVSLNLLSKVESILTKYSSTTVERCCAVSKIKFVTESNKLLYFNEESQYGAKFIKESLIDKEFECLIGLSIALMFIACCVYKLLLNKLIL